MEDLDCPESIRQYVRKVEGIDVYEYVNRGLQGEVYFGKRTKLGDEVALKFYLSLTREFVDSEECAVLGRIDHDNILKVYHVDFVRPSYGCIISPKIGGGDLRTMVDSRNISFHKALSLTASILEGVVELHSQHKMVHRDLKPSNILYDEKKDCPIIADLGLVKKIGSEMTYTSCSQTDLFFLPPESIDSGRYYFESDIYQVGLILFNLLLGFYPIYEPHKWLSKRELKEYKGASSDQTRRILLEEKIKLKIQKGKLTDLNSLPKYLPPKVLSILRRSLQINPSNRYNAPNFLNEINKLLRSTPDFYRKEDKINVKTQKGTNYYIDDSAEQIKLYKKVNSGKWRCIIKNLDGTMKACLTEIDKH